MVKRIIYVWKIVKVLLIEICQCREDLLLFVLHSHQSMYLCNVCDTTTI